MLYNQNRARAKSGDKIKKLIDHVIELKKREQAEGQTNRLKMAWFKANAKLKKYSITEGMVNATLEKRGLSHLITN